MAQKDPKTVAEYKTALEKLGVSIKAGILLPQLKSLYTRAMNKSAKESEGNNRDSASTKAPAKPRAKKSKEVQIEGVRFSGFFWQGKRVFKVLDKGHTKGEYHCSGKDGNDVITFHVPKERVEREVAKLNAK